MSSASRIIINMTIVRPSLLLFALLCNGLNHSSSGFTFSTRRSSTTQGRSSLLVPTRRTQWGEGPPMADILRHQRSQQSPTPFSLHAVPTSAIVVGHVIGGALAAPLTAKAIKSWYTKINLPSWTPPNKVFGPIWTLLYASMGYSVARILKQLPTGTIVWYKTLPMQWWILHYALNLTWAPVFFAAKRFRTSAVINALLLTTFVGRVLPLFAQVDIVAARILIPYTLWLTLANALNLAICRLNPGSYNTARFESDLLRLQQEASTYAGL